MSITIQKINEEVVKPPITKSQLDKDKLFKNRFPSIAIIGKRGSGKSSSAFYIAEHFLRKWDDLGVFIFSDTIHQDPTYRKLKEKWTDKEDDRTRVFLRDNIYPKPLTQRDKDNGLEDAFGDLLNSMKEDQDTEDIQPKMIIIDDMPEALKYTRVSNFLKKARHFHCIIVLCCHNAKDLNRRIRSNLNNLILYPSLPETDLKELYENCNIASIPFKIFYKLYLLATSQAHNFFYVDTTLPEEFRKNFDILISIKGKNGSMDFN